MSLFEIDTVYGRGLCVWKDTILKTQVQKMKNYCSGIENRQLPRQIWGNSPRLEESVKSRACILVSCV